MQGPFGIFSVSDAKAIKARVLGGQVDTLPQPAIPSTAGNGPYFAILMADMDAATSPLDGYSETNAKILRYTLADDNYDMEEATDDEEVNVVNRSQAEATAGTLVVIFRVGSEFAPIWVDCSASDDGAEIAGV